MEVANDEEELVLPLELKTALPLSDDAVAFIAKTRAGKIEKLLFIVPFFLSLSCRLTIIIDNMDYVGNI